MISCLSARKAEPQQANVWRSSNFLNPTQVSHDSVASSESCAAHLQTWHTVYSQRTASNDLNLYASAHATVDLCR